MSAFTTRSLGCLPVLWVKPLSGFTHKASAAAQTCAAVAFLLLAGVALAQNTDSFHRAAQDREISYWLLAPETHQFRISHDFNVSRPGQKYVHSFVRAGSVVSTGSRMFDL